MANYVGVRDVWFGREIKPVEVYANGSGRFFVLEGPGGIREDVYFNENAKRWEERPDSHGYEK